MDAMKMLGVMPEFFLTPRPPIDKGIDPKKKSLSRKAWAHRQKLAAIAYASKRKNGKLAA